MGTLDNHKKNIEIGDKLEYIFDKQRKLISQDHLVSQTENPDKTTPVPAGLDSENKMRRLYEMEEPFAGYRIFMISSALLHEVVELQRETNWKWWKKNKAMETEKIQEEVVDLWHFLIQLSIETGLDPEKLISKYIDKNKENIDRQHRGY